MKELLFGAYWQAAAFFALVNIPESGLCGRWCCLPSDTSPEVIKQACDWLGFYPVREG